MWGRGLKLSNFLMQHQYVMSPPMWGRGLKQLQPYWLIADQRRPPCGGVDWNNFFFNILLNRKCCPLSTIRHGINHFLRHLWLCPYSAKCQQSHHPSFRTFRISHHCINRWKYSSTGEASVVSPRLCVRLSYQFLVEDFKNGVQAIIGRKSEFGFVKIIHKKQYLREPLF